MELIVRETIIFEEIYKMEFQQKCSLQDLNTFGINVFASYLSTFTSIEELDFCIKNLPTKKLLILGGGSNVLFTHDIDSTVLLNRIKGIELISEDTENVFVKVGAGEVWHEFVLTCIANKWCGVENLSLIPGNVGAGPMQNIGAYGVELKDVFHELEAYEIKTGKTRKFFPAECAFGYRESVFKHDLKDQFVITSVTFKLTKRPAISTHYGAIQTQLSEMGIIDPTIKNVSDAVIAIRKSKLPDPKQIGNAGSFFKNPVIPTAKVRELQEKYPSIPVYEIDEHLNKVPAGWLIEQAGWKGKTFGNFGVHKNQALVLVNYGGADGNSIEKLSRQIMDSILEKFGVQLEREVNIIS